MPSQPSLAALRRTLRVVPAVLVSALVVSSAHPTIEGRGSVKPVASYTDPTTARVVDRLDGHGGGAWFATTLDSHGYKGPRKAEITRVAAGHGKRSVGVIHVPPQRATQARRALSYAWVAKKGPVFVIPLRSSTNTEGGGGKPFRQRATWAANRLGDGWHVV